jgi:hypothetical protein
MDTASNCPTCGEDTKNYRYNAKTLVEKRKSISLVKSEITRVGQEHRIHTYEWRFEETTIRIEVIELTDDNEKRKNTVIQANILQDDSGYKLVKVTYSLVDNKLSIKDVNLPPRSGKCVASVTCALLSVCAWMNSHGWPLPKVGFVSVQSEHIAAGMCYVRAFQILNFKVYDEDSTEKIPSWSPHGGFCHWEASLERFAYQMLFVLDGNLYFIKDVAATTDDEKVATTETQYYHLKF